MIKLATEKHTFGTKLLYFDWVCLLCNDVLWQTFEYEYLEYFLKTQAKKELFSYTIIIATVKACCTSVRHHSAKV